MIGTDAYSPTVQHNELATARLVDTVSKRLEKEADPLRRYHLLAEALANHQEAMERLAHLRDEAVLLLYKEVAPSYAKVAELTGMSRPRVQQIVERFKSRTNNDAQ